jgi:hypothetical protein
MYDPIEEMIAWTMLIFASGGAILVLVDLACAVAR